LRIISGSAGGRRLFTPGNPQHNRHIRPTSDRSREAIFNIIGFDRLKDSVVLDLFAGTGALGIEALSRGAAHAFFVDNYQPAVNLISRNLSVCDFSELSHLLKRDLSKGLFFLKSLLQNLNDSTTNFDLVFLDPPYDEEQAVFFLSELQANQLLNPASLVIFEDRSQAKLPEHVEGLSLFDQRKYGDTGFWLYSST
jgi:16S rRNA (guanine966-N2)-methyltransferase